MLRRMAQAVVHQVLRPANAIDLMATFVAVIARRPVALT